MEAVYAKGEATLTEILDYIEDPPTRAALRSILTILEDKGRLRHSQRGREFVYRATRSRAKEGRNAFRRLLQTFFDGSLGDALASHLSSPEADYSSEEIDELMAHLDALKKNSRRAPASRNTTSRKGN